MKTFNDIVQAKKKENIIKGSFKVSKADTERRFAFGWASISLEEDGGQLVDLAGDMIEPEVLEKAAYNFVIKYREGGEMHERGGTAVLIESMVFTPEKLEALGLQQGSLPTGWWIGFYVTDDEVWEKVKSGEYPMFSIEGRAVREKA